ncbi:MAG: alpha-glucosidase [Cyanobacteria bacterium Co-bin13]|nr:alpha-glucosidase [Cyanobacteria bacterium Co-bin13]
MKLLRKLMLRVQALLRSLFFLQFLPASFLYAFQRDRNERRFAPPAAPAASTRPGQLQKAVPTERGAHFVFEQATLDLEFLTADLVCLTWQPGLLPVPYAIARQDWDVVTTTLKPSDTGWTLTSEVLTVTVGPEGEVRLCSRNGNLLRQDNSPEWCGESWTHRTPLPPEAHIYGLGERITGLNLRAARDSQGQPKTFSLWNTDPANISEPGQDPLYITMPVYLGLHHQGSYLTFYENSFKGEMQFGEQAAVAQFSGGALRYYLAAGDPPQLLERFSELTGRAPLPPRWALGYHQSRWGYRTEATVRAEVELFQRYDLPISAVHLDIDCQVGHRSFTLDPDRFPNLCQFTRELREAGVRLVAINNPGIKHSRHSNLFLEGRVLNAFCTYPNGELVVAPVWPGQTVFPDFTNPQVRAWWSYQFAYLLDVGIAGFWNDMNEPVTFASWGETTLPLVTRHSLEGRGGNHREAHNLYGMLESRAAYESLCQHRPERRPFIVSRSGWVGMQRYAWTWTGDTLSTWEALRLTVGTVVGLGLSGVPFSGPDIGGFLGNPSAELYVRWFQMATFLAFYRTHCSIGVDPRAPWTYGEPTLSTIRYFLQLRYRLLPYLYTLAWEAAQQGHPPVRPLFWYSSDDPELWAIEDQFYLGKALLVCPVVQAELRSRPVHLPQGYWYDFWSDVCWEGGKTLPLEAPLERLPLLVKAGTVLPMAAAETLTLHLYPLPQGESQSQIYSDAGEGYGPSRLDRFRLTRQDSQLTLAWETSGDYPFPYQQVTLQVHGLALQKAWVDGQEVALREGQVDCGPFQQAHLVCAA